MTVSSIVTAVDYDDLLRRGIATAKSGPDVYSASQLGAKLATRLDHDTCAQVLARALLALAEPGRVGSLDEVRDQIAEALCDNAHEHCDHETGCTGGGGAWWNKYVDDLIMPVLREYTVPAEAAS